MSSPPLPVVAALPTPGAALPGLALALALAALAWLTGRVQSLMPPAVIAVGLGMLALPLVPGARMAPGLKLATGPLLRTAVALLGLRLSLADMAGVGVARMGALMLAMLATLLVCRQLARGLGLSLGAGLIMGAANAICGAAAAFAMAAALPAAQRDARILLLSVVLANAVSTLAMVLQPALAAALGFSPAQAGLLAGASIQDMAQVVAVTAPLPQEAGMAGVTLKMMRVLLLLPVVMLMSRGLGEGGAAPRLPAFAFAFIGLCLVNSALESLPAAAGWYGPLRLVLLDLSGALLLVALAAMGLGTSLRGLMACGWRPLALFGAGALTILSSGVLIARFV